MAYTYNQPRFPTKNNYAFYPSKNLSLNGGINVVDLEEKLRDNQTSKCLNVWFKDGELDKRWGQDYLDSEESPGVARSAHRYFFGGVIVKHCGTKLYAQDVLDGSLTELYTGLNDADSSIFKYNEKLYLKQVGKYVEFDGVTAQDVVPRIPTVVINRPPNGAGGNSLDDYNRIGAGFKNSFNGNNVATAYTLTDQNLDATAVVAVVNGVTLVEGVGFTVNRTTGVVTFSVAPSTGTNNVIITAYKTDQDAIDSILNCKAVIAFGGQNDNRLFFGNNGTGNYYWTGISEVGVDPTYFPYNNFNTVGLSDENVFAFGKQYDTLVILKEREIYGVNYSFDGTKGVFNSYPINDQYGCDCPNTVELVNNNLVWLSTTFGVCILVGTQVQSERNAFIISRNIDPLLKQETNLDKATSADFEGKYWLSVDDTVYMWDYFISPYINSTNPDDSAEKLSWWVLDTIDSAEFIYDGRDLYYLQRSGKTVKFHTTYDNDQFYDFGNAISSVYRYPKRELGGGILEFSVLKGFVNVRGDRKSSHTVTYFTSDNPNGDPFTESVDVGSFSWANFSWLLFTWRVMGPLYNWVLMPFLKNIRWFAAEFSNNTPGTGMNISSMQWQYQTTRMIR